jgi:polyphosphate kinase
VIDECLVPYLHDRQDAWALHGDGSQARIGGDGPGAQQALVARYSGAP